MEVDIEPLISESLEKLKTNGIKAAIEYLMPFEKQARSTINVANCSRLLVHMIEMCHDAKDMDILNEQIVVLSKKRGQPKQALTALVQRAFKFVEEETDLPKKLSLISTLLSICEGKIFVEVEKARLTMILCKIKLNEGKIKEAADDLFDLQIETFGSMDKKEKYEYFIEQMRLGLVTNNYIRAQIISKKINPNSLESDDLIILKFPFYEMMIQLYLHDNNYLECAKNSLQIYNTKSISEDPIRKLEALKKVVVFTVLSPFDHEQSDFMHRLSEDKFLDKIPLYKNLINCFVSKELIRWPAIETLCLDEFSKDVLFSTSLGGPTRWVDLKDRVIEHNIRIISSAYNRITLSRLATMLDSDIKSAEEAFSKLVVQKTIFAKLDRPSGIINFIPKQESSEILDEWSQKVQHLLDLVVKANHLISKEEVIHSIAKI